MALNITTGYTAINQGSIVSDSLAITANDFFRIPNRFLAC